MLISSKRIIGNMIFFLLLMRGTCKRKHLKAMGFHPPLVNMEKMNYKYLFHICQMQNIKRDSGRRIAGRSQTRQGKPGSRLVAKKTICVLFSPGSSFPLCHFQLCPRPSLLIREVCQAIPPEGLLDTLEDFGTNLDWSTSYIDQAEAENAQIVQKHKCYFFGFFADFRCFTLI